ncbi:MAG TPA: hypothetical protein VHW09_07445 [Bryobacteraceae bacterium]|jgi:hypothetical protein|nr:hypothetical protein [Bryobacteraceae bacterium]
MTPELDRWMKLATRHLSRSSADQVRTEIAQHYESALEAAMERGARGDDADLAAVASLGDARVANRQYRKVLLTSAEARLLREGQREARTVCSYRLVLRWIPLAGLIAVTVLFLTGRADFARTLLAASLAFGLMFVAPALPIYTQSRSRIVRIVKWVLLAAMPLLAFWPDIRQFSWLLIACLWPIAWVEWTRVSLRRKLPVAQWPKHLYL